MTDTNSIVFVDALGKRYRKHPGRPRTRTREERLAYMREWRANNHEKQASYFQAWRDANRERKAAADKAWRDKNRERVRESHRSSELQRRAKKRGRFVEYVDPQIVLDQNQGLCGICWDPIVDQDFHVDHIIPLCLDGEHSYENAQPAHPRCNLSKGGRLAS